MKILDLDRAPRKEIEDEEYILELKAEQLKEEYSLKDEQIKRLEEIVTHEDSLQKTWDALEKALSEFTAERGEIHSTEFLRLDHTPENSTVRTPLPRS